MDRITKNLMESFLQEYELESEGEACDFEKFSNYCIISHEHSETFKIDEVTVGSSNDTGLDGIAIIVNGRIVNSIEEVDDLSTLNGYIEAKFIFIQSKTSSRFESGDMLKFFEGVFDFFEEEPTLSRNKQVSHKAKIAQHIYSLPRLMSRGRPICKLYYVTTGKWHNNDTNLVKRIDSKQAKLLETENFEQVYIYPLGSNEIRKLYQSTILTIATDIIFERRIVLPQITGISESYIGILPFPEYKKLIIDEFDNIRLSIFYDNVRAFQTYNDVNTKIKNTIESGNIDRFAVLNNGTTIIAKSLDTVGNKFTIRDYQIVNGCQTSHVIYDCRNTSGIEDLHIPVKIIVAEDEVISDIILATNSQTPVKKEELEALSEFQKKLENYYNSFDSSQEGRLYYERRSKQYNSRAEVPKSRIITVKDQIKTFAAMFLEQPHKVGQIYQNLFKDIGTKIFHENHQPVAYYTSSLAYYKLENLLNSRGKNKLDSKFKKYKYHLLMIFRYLVVGYKTPNINKDKEINSYCKKINSILCSKTKWKKYFEKSAHLLEEFCDNLGYDMGNRDKIFSQEFVKQLQQKLEQELVENESK
ncbi:MAG: AIPR family protein [Rivularia sp. (in: Bacteria)]|nr:AIPR family protein [Rivularia sp. MS3]